MVKQGGNMIKSISLLGLLLFPLIAFGNTSAKITKIYATTRGGFAGLLSDGTITAWGNSSYGGSIPQSVTTALGGRKVRKIIPGNCAFAALAQGGLLVTWGAANCGGDSSAVATRLASGVKKVVTTKADDDIYGRTTGAFAALKNDGSVVTWGKDYMGGDSLGVAHRLGSGVSKIIANHANFAALKNDGSVVTWGYRGADNFLYWSDYYKRQIDPFYFLQDGVSNVYAGRNSFLALKNDNSLVPWGMVKTNGNGHDSSFSEYSKFGQQYREYLLQ